MGIKYRIMGKIRGKKMKFIPLFKDHRSYSTKTYANKVAAREREYRPEIIMRIDEVYISHCGWCGQEINN